MVGTLLDFLFPRHSLTGREGEWVTRSEMLQMRAEPVIVDKAFLVASGIHSLDRVVAAAGYRQMPLLRRAVHTLKYRRIPELAASLVSLLVVASYVMLPSSAPILTAVPLHWTRRFWRGFNQAELLAAALAAERGWTYQALLKRTRRTRSQVTLDREGRLGNLNNAFSFRGIVVPEHVILIDDLFTTGSTLDACAAALKRAGVKRVEGLVLARG
jgi:ComF family protein